MGPVQQRGYEGLVAKDPRAPYDPQRTRWLKVKVRHDGRFVVGGVIQRDDLHALFVGSRHDRRLHLVGVVEFGVGRRLIAALLEHIPVRDSSPFDNVSRWYGATWLEPVLQAEITYAEVMQGRLRDPVFRALYLQPTVPPVSVTRRGRTAPEGSRVAPEARNRPSSEVPVHLRPGGMGETWQTTCR